MKKENETINNMDQADYDEDTSADEDNYGTTIQNPKSKLSITKTKEKHTSSSNSNSSSDQTISSQTKPKSKSITPNTWSTPATSNTKHTLNKPIPPSSPPQTNDGTKSSSKVMLTSYSYPCTQKNIFSMQQNNNYIHIQLKSSENKQNKANIDINMKDKVTYYIMMDILNKQTTNIYI